MRVFAIDGSTLCFPNRRDVSGKFGTAYARNGDVPMARIALLHDVFNRSIVQNPTLKQIITLTNPLKGIKSGWRVIRNYRNVFMEYFGEDRNLLSIT